jgi:hypothetical protein
MKKKIVKTKPKPSPKSKTSISKPTSKVNSPTKIKDKPLKKMVVTKNGLVEVDIEPKDESKKDTRKYIKIYDNDPIEKRKEVSEKVFKKELKFVYYASDGPHGVWYYIKP